MYCIVLLFNKILTYIILRPCCDYFCILAVKSAFMKFTPSRLNTFLFFRLPSAFWCGVRVKAISPTECTVAVKHRWFNQNPFNSIYFAVQAMAAELATGVLVMQAINESRQKVSMLVAGNKCTFTKKARGRIVFKCSDGRIAVEAIERTIATGEGQAFTMVSTGTDEKGDTVSIMEFEWTVKVKKS